MSARTRRAWQREWNVMKKHSTEFCGPGHRGGQMLGMCVEPRTPLSKMAPSTQGDADRRYLALCRELKKVSEEAFGRLAAQHSVPQCFAPYVVCIAAMLTGLEDTPQGAWQYVAPMLRPSDVLLASLLNLDPLAVTEETQPILDRVPSVDREALELISPAALAIAQWCVGVADYRAYLMTTGGSAVVPGVPKTVSCSTMESPSKPMFMCAASPRGMTSHRSSSRSLSQTKRSRSARKSVLVHAPVPVAEPQPRLAVRPLNSPPVVKNHFNTPSVVSWLHSLGLSPFAGILIQNEIDIQALPLLTEQDLEDMGIPIGPKRMMLNSISEMCAEDPLRYLG